MSRRKKKEVPPPVEESKPQLEIKLFENTGDYLRWLNEDPRKVDKNPDGSDYVPISIIQEDLFLGYHGNTRFELLRENFHTRGLSAVGRLHYKHPITNEWLFQDGSAAIAFSGGLHLDFPNVHARVQLSCAKKIGKRFGRELNRDQEDKQVIDIVVETAEELSKEESRLIKLIQKATTIEMLAQFKKDTNKVTMPYYMEKLKELTNAINK